MSFSFVVTYSQRVNSFFISKYVHGNRRILFLKFVDFFPASGEVYTVPIELLRLFLQFFINTLRIVININFQLLY